MNFMLETLRPGQSDPLRQKFFTRDAMIAAMKSLMKFHFVGHMEPFCKVDGRWELDSEALALLTNQGVPERQMVLENASKFLAQLAREVEPITDELKSEIIDLFQTIFQVCGIQDNQEELDPNSDPSYANTQLQEGALIPDSWLLDREPSVLDATSTIIVPPGDAGITTAGLEREEYPA